MNRRSFLSLFGLAPIAAMAARAAADAATAPVVGIDGGGADDVLAACVWSPTRGVRPIDLTTFVSRTFEVEEICHIYRIPPDQLGPIEIRGLA
jgi:hypothetical protein